MALQFKVTLEGTDNPVVWRRIVLPNDATFFDLHLAIQGAFKWKFSHMFHFLSTDGTDITIGQPEFFRNSPYENEAPFDARGEWVFDYFQEKEDTMTYVYDMGDNWEHSIVLEGADNAVMLSPRCAEGEGAAPPEDIGGIGSYYQLLDDAENPHSPFQLDARMSLGLSNGKSWNPNEFSLTMANLWIEAYIRKEYFAEDESSEN